MDGDRYNVEATRTLVGQARAGDREAFARLYERLAPALIAWARLRVPPGLAVRLDPEDLVGEVWVRALRFLERYDPSRGPFRPWIFQVAKHVLLDALRRSRSAPVAAAAGRAVDDHGWSQVPAEATAVSARAARIEGLDLFLRWTSTLDEDERGLVVHCGLEGLPAAEVARRLGRPVGTLERRWHRLRERFRDGGFPRELIEDAGL